MQLQMVSGSHRTATFCGSTKELLCNITRHRFTRPERFETPAGPVVAAATAAAADLIAVRRRQSAGAGRRTATTHDGRRLPADSDRLRPGLPTGCADGGGCIIAQRAGDAVPTRRSCCTSTGLHWFSCCCCCSRCCRHAKQACGAVVVIFCQVNDCCRRLGGGSDRLRHCIGCGARPLRCLSCGPAATCFHNCMPAAAVGTAGAASRGWVPRWLRLAGCVLLSCTLRHTHLSNISSFV